ncbi:hypothetical protein Btru_024042 [Bulinus truncatus]|nr:hypothetical protein Btru_024042 [Bulinus truncatus]
MSSIRDHGVFGYKEFTASASKRMEAEENIQTSGRTTTWNPWSARNDQSPSAVPINECTRDIYEMVLRQRTNQDDQRLHIQNPDRLLTESASGATNDDEFLQSHIDMPPKLPNWIWSTLVSVLGIKTPVQHPLWVANLLHILTLLAALSFGASGLVFNVLDSLSSFYKTSILVTIAKSIIGLYWIGIGIYANSLAARLFSNKRMIDCIRLHSKTFLKISSSIIVVLLSVAVVATNLYTNTYLLDDEHMGNKTKPMDSNCASLGKNMLLCQIYFGSKVVYSFLCLTWNLLVACIYLSVCRTHTISIRRFMKELMYDTKIFEEFCKIQALEEQQLHNYFPRKPSIVPDKKLQDFHEYDVWHDDIAHFDNESHSEPPQNAQLLRTLRVMRQNTKSQLFSETINRMSESPREIGTVSERVQALSKRRWTLASTPSDDGAVLTREEKMFVGSPEIGRIIEDQVFQSGVPESPSPDSDPNGPQPEETKSSFCGQRPPIMRNEDLMFTYFQLLRRLSSTSRLLQRWISNWITFILFWCALLIVYWTTHAAEISGIVQFLTPLVALGLITSAYAEVNFEGERLLKCVLPTEERMPVLYYIQNTKLELKIFSFTMTYNTIVTVVAGVAVTFATRIILDQKEFDFIYSLNSYTVFRNSKHCTTKQNIHSIVI